jgi:hypothetical protein
MIDLRRREFLVGGALAVAATAMGKASQPPYPEPAGPPGAPFADVNFKLAVLSALADDGVIDLGAPPQLAEHVLQRPFDIDREGYAPVPAVRDYLARYPLTPKMLGAIENFNLDGGSGIYHHIWHFWHGEDDTFDIRSLDGIEHCPNIRELGVASMVPSVDIRLLTPLRRLAHLHIGVDVAEIPALLDLAGLESVQILNDTVYAEVTAPGHPTRAVMETLKQRGVRVWVHWVSHEEQPPAFE